MQYLPLEHNISPEQAFGQASTLAVAPTSEGYADAALYGLPFQIGVVLIGLVYTFFIVRYWDFLRYFIIASLGFKQIGRNKAHINPAEQKNIEVVMIILGLLLLSLALVRVCGLWFPHLLNGISPQDAIWIVGGIAAVALSLILLFQFITITLSAAICQRQDIGNGLIETKLLYMAVIFVIIIPFGIMFLLGPKNIVFIGAAGMILGLFIWQIIFVKESFLFFVSQKISILLWFLYLCALEIFPLSLILAPIMR